MDKAERRALVVDVLRDYIVFVHKSFDSFELIVDYKVPDKAEAAKWLSAVMEVWLDAQGISLED